MKKTISIISFIVSIALFCSCGLNSSPENTSSSSEVAATSSVPLVNGPTKVTMATLVSAENRQVEITFNNPIHFTDTTTLFICNHPIGGTFQGAAKKIEYIEPISIEEIDFSKTILATFDTLIDLKTLKPYAFQSIPTTAMIRIIEAPGIKDKKIDPRTVHDSDNNALLANYFETEYDVAYCFITDEQYSNSAHLINSEIKNSNTIFIEFSDKVAILDQSSIFISDVTGKQFKGNISKILPYNSQEKNGKQYSEEILIEFYQISMCGTTTLYKDGAIPDDAYLFIKSDLTAVSSINGKAVSALVNLDNKNYLRIKLLKKGDATKLLSAKIKDLVKKLVTLKFNRPINVVNDGFIYYCSSPEGGIYQSDPNTVYEYVNPVLYENDIYSDEIVFRCGSIYDLTKNPLETLINQKLQKGAVFRITEYNLNDTNKGLISLKVMKDIFGGALTANYTTSNGIDITYTTVN